MVTGNVVENAPNAGIAAGWGAYLRDVAITSNVIRGADYGITVSVAPGAGTAVIADNLISDARSGAIVGMEWKKPVTGDLAKDGASPLRAIVDRRQPRALARALDPSKKAATAPPFAPAARPAPRQANASPPRRRRSSPTRRGCGIASRIASRSSSGV